MATINYWGLTGVKGTVTVDLAVDTFDTLIAVIASDEGLPTDYYTVTLQRDPSKGDIIYGDSSTPLDDASIGIIDGDTIICTPNQRGTKEDRQIQKLGIAAAKRGETYDINKLPSKYSGNDVIDNDNTGGLEPRRPWIIDYSRVMDGMVLWLDAGDTDSYPGTGTTWTDLAGTANNFTLYNTPTWNSAGYFDFDPASSEYAAIIHADALKPTEALTMEQWLNADDWAAGTSPAYFTALSCTQGGGYAHYIWDSTFIPYVYVVSLSNYLKPTASIAGFTGWHHFATTFDGRYARLYIDGALAATADAGSSTTISYDSDNDICIGVEAGPASVPQGFYWDGKIATTAIYNRALTAAEVLKNYNSDKSRFENLQSVTENPTVVTSNLVVHLDAGNSASYPGSGTTWTNLVDSTPYTIVSGSYDSGSIVFDGISTYVAIGTPLTNGTNFTKEAWVLADVVTSSRNIISSTSNVLWNNGATLSAGVGGSYSLVTSASFPTGVWKHVVQTFDDTTNTMRLYINGVQVSQNLSVTQSYVSEIERVGAHYSGSSPVSFWDGKIAQVRIYSEALSATDVLANYDNTKATFGL